MNTLHATPTDRDGFRPIAHSQADLPPITLYKPASLVEALDDIRTARAPAAIYAGGTDFFAQLREGRSPVSLIWLNAVRELRKIDLAQGNVRVGALVSHHDACRDARIKAIPGLAEAWRRIATVRIRWQATLGGNLMARRTRYELSILLGALGALAHFAGPDREVVIPVADIWTADLATTPLLTAVHIPIQNAPRLDYERSMRPTFTQALCRTGDRLRLVVATEHLRPWTTDFGLQDPADDILAHLPADFQDPAVGRDYIQRAGTAFLKRQIKRLEGSA